MRRKFQEKRRLFIQKTANLSISKVLECARDTLSDPKKWTQNDFSKSKKGNKVSPVSQYAETFCVLGAVHRCVNEMVSCTTQERKDIVEIIAPYLNSGADQVRAQRDLLGTIDYGIVSLNDYGGYDLVMEAFDLAQEKALEFEESGHGFSTAAERRYGIF